MHASFEGLAGSDRTLVGGWISIGHESVVETMFAQPYDYIGIDTQHTTLDVAAAARLMHAAPKGGPAALVRVPANTAADIGKVFDAGADGVIVPMVNTGQEARAAVSACRYAPGGLRSFGPMRIGMPYDVAALTARTACFVMAETQMAVDNIDDICATPELAGVYIGPGDLAVSLGFPVALEVMPEPLLRAVTAIAQACRRAGIIAGGHFPLSQVGQVRALGLQMITVGADRGYLASGARADIAAARSAALSG